MVEDLHGNNKKSLQKSLQLTNISYKGEVLANIKVKVANLYACVLIDNKVWVGDMLTSNWSFNEK
jgi:hypothetical protein